MSFSCTDKDTLVAFIYGECDAETRAAVEEHLEACLACSDEVSGFGVVREALGQWSPPERSGSFKLVREEEAPVTAKVLRPARWWQSAVPALARVAAAVLLVAGGAALANLEVRYDKDGFVVRTGWGKGQAATSSQAAAQPAATAVVQPTASPASQQAAVVPAAMSQQSAADQAPWRADLVAFQRQMRDEFRQQLASARTVAPAPATQAVAANFVTDEKLYSALDEIERRQQVNVATYMSRLVSDIQAGRALDMRRIGIDSLPPALPQKPKPANLFDVTFPVKK
jgi:hypothetical protein